MAKKIIWSPLAQEKRKEILNFWIQNNKSNSFSIKLNNQFIEATKLMSLYPKIGRITDIEEVRVKIVKSYQVFYQIQKESILILTIWDSRQNPNKLTLK